MEEQKRRRGETEKEAKHWRSAVFKSNVSRHDPSRIATRNNADQLCSDHDPPFVRPILSRFQLIMLLPWLFNRPFFWYFYYEIHLK